MAKKAKELKPIQVQRLVGKDGLHAVGGVAGLYLQVRGDSSAWILRIIIGDRRRHVGLGGYPDVTLSQARDKARVARAKVAEGIDPVAERRAGRAGLMSVLSFSQCTERLLEARSHEWKNPKHVAQWRSTLDTYAGPIIGKLPVDQIELRHVVDVLTPIWTTKTETASRLRGRIESVLAWATVSGYRTGDNPARWKGNLDHVLAKPSKVSKVKHHKALPADIMHSFMADLRQCDCTSARAADSTLKCKELVTYWLMESHR